jgi:proteasome lid subunit RPN8/RPN11
MNNLGTIGEIKITKKLKDQIDFLHKKIGTTEWSGVLFYKTETTDFSVLKNLKFTANDMFLMDIGSSVYTEYEFNKNIMTAYDVIEDAIESDIGMIHTHHSMGAFFSGTDIKELEDNSKLYNYYISLIVDFKEEYQCKIVFPSKSKSTTTSKIKDQNGNNIEVITEKEEISLLSGDLIVKLENDVNIDKWIVDRYNKVKEEKAKVLAKTYTPNGYNSFNNKRPVGFNPLSQEYPSLFKNDHLRIKEEDKVEDDLIEKFLIELLTLGVQDGDEDVVDVIKDFDEEELIESYIEAISMNVEIFHFNIFGTEEGLDSNLKDALEYLELFNTSDNCKLLIKKLTNEQ